MANKFPLVFNTDANQIQELASGDNLDLTESGLVNAANIAASNIDIAGISTFGSSNGIGTVTVGIGTTALLVQGNTRITGTLSIGSSTIVIDGSTDTITASNIIVTNNITQSGGVGYATEGYVTNSLVGLASEGYVDNSLVGYATEGYVNQVSGVGIATEGGTVGTGVTLLDFRGAGISTVTASAGIATVNITGGGGGVSESTAVALAIALG